RGTRRRGRGLEPPRGPYADAPSLRGGWNRPILDRESRRRPGGSLLPAERPRRADRIPRLRSLPARTGDPGLAGRRRGWAHRRLGDPTVSSSAFRCDGAGTTRTTRPVADSVARLAPRVRSG